MNQRHCSAICSSSSTVILSPARRRLRARGFVRCDHRRVLNYSTVLQVSDPAPATQTEAPIGPVPNAATGEMAEPEAPPLMPEPMMIEIISNPPPDELGGSIAGHGSA